MAGCVHRDRSGLNATGHTLHSLGRDRIATARISHALARHTHAMPISGDHKTVSRTHVKRCKHWLVDIIHDFDYH